MAAAALESVMVPPPGVLDASVAVPVLLPGLDASSLDSMPSAVAFVDVPASVVEVSELLRQAARQRPNASVRAIVDIIFFILAALRVWCKIKSALPLGDYIFAAEYYTIITFNLKRGKERARDGSGIPASPDTAYSPTAARPSRRAIKKENRKPHRLRFSTHTFAIIQTYFLYDSVKLTRGESRRVTAIL